ncbi:ABC-type lipoprotein export system ATPase subunit [Enterococcus sp. PF1-24]|nr:ABC-type lipoprotein export system ATPase subunit [Enterococcus sp. PFB1-1]MDH6400595.1 ABC-type lipoprotein export system ATPase subunit [Enterococcus sp. PF1-24]
MTHALVVSNVSKKYNMVGSSIQVLSNVSFSISQGEFTGIMGSSGSGKSTLLDIIGTIDQSTGGYVLIGDQRLDQLSENQLSEFRRDKLGFIFQNYNLLDALTLRENIALALVIQNKPKQKVD